MAAKYYFSGGSLCNLKKYCEDGIAVLFLNDIILREAASHIDEDVGLRSGFLSKAPCCRPVRRQIRPGRIDEMSEWSDRYHFLFESVVSSGIHSEHRPGPWHP